MRRRTKHGERNMGATITIATLTVASLVSGASDSPARASISAEQRAGIVRSYQIPAGSMSKALNAVAGQNGLLLLYDAALTESLRTPGLSGRYSTQEALDRLLAGTRLSYRFSADGETVSILLAQNDAVRSDAGGAEALPTIDIGAQAPATPTRGRGEPATPTEGYVVTNATTATKTDAPVRQTPVSVQIVPKQVMQDQNVTSIQEAIENVPGVRSNSNDVEGYNFTIRGFPSTPVFRNGLSNAGSTGVFDTANLERIEILKGPASILYGRIEPGGLVNLVTKQPLDAQRFVVEQQIGSYDHYRTQWDFSAPVPEIPGLAYRVSGAYQSRGSFKSFQGGDRVLIAPVVSYRPSEWTEFTLDTQYSYASTQSDAGHQSVGAGPAPIPIGRSIQEPNDPRDRIETYNIGYTFRQNLDQDWKVVNRFLYSAAPFYEKPNITPICKTPYCLDADLRTLHRVTQYQFSTNEAFSTNIDLLGKFSAFGGAHNFLMGLDYLNNYSDYIFTNGAVDYPIDIFAPAYGLVPSFAYHDAMIGSGFKYLSSTLVRQKGFYVQDHVTWFDRLHVLLGGRFDAADVTVGEAYSEAGDYSASKDQAIAARLGARTRTDSGWSPRAGLVYDLLPELSAYGSYSQSFGANNGISASGQTFAPQRGQQWEVGLKAEPLQGLSATLAFYQITKSNLLTRDFSSTDPSVRKLAGLQRSRGIELDVIGRVTDRLAVVANYAYTDAKVINDAPKEPLDPFGGGLYLNHLLNAPRHSGKIFLTYDFGDNGLGFRVGGGVTASTHAWGDAQNTFLIPGWARLDGFASYTTLFEGHKVTAQLNLRNITDARYFTGVDNYFNYNTPPTPLFPARPFTATGSLRFEW
jgi:iron complex outermembrane receptor protein